jgi:predicted DNA-binding ribbon-helix-helix protein
MTPDFNRAWKHHIEEDALDDFRGKLVVHHVRIGDRRTTVRLTPLTRRLLQEIAQRSAATVRELCTAISSEKPRTMPLTVAIRAVVLCYYLDVVQSK